MIKANESELPVRLMCRTLNVSSSGYCDWRQRPAPKRAQANGILADDVKRIFEEKRRVELLRITKRLQQEGRCVGRKQVAKIMRENGWRARAAQKYKTTTNSNHTLPVAQNLLEQNFESGTADHKWVSDITYIWTAEGWLYLAVVLDLYSRMAVGWAMSERMTATLVCDALQMALWRRKRPRGVIVHSDRGSQYCSHEYQRMLFGSGLICSMSKKGDCYDNAAMESWNHSFKVEAIHGEYFDTRAQAKSHVFDYIDVYYNRKRLHSKLG